MKKEKIKNILLIVIVALVTSFVTAYGVSSTFDSSNVCYKYDSSTSASVQEAVDDLYERASNYTEIRNMIYPVGSIYISVTDDTVAKVQDRFGGTWEQIKDKFILASGDIYANNTTGGSSTHQHYYGIQLASYYMAPSFETDTYSGLFDYSDNVNYIIKPINKIETTKYELLINNAMQSSYKTVTSSRLNAVAKTSSTSTLPPYYTVYMYKRVN